MDNRLAAMTAAVLLVSVAGCSSPPSAVGNTTAKVTIDGQSTGGPHTVRCSQTGWAWTIESADEAKGFKAVIDTGDTVTARLINFRDLGGFTGSFWNDNIGEAKVTGVGGKYTIEGSADGSFTDKPLNAVTATFRIEANC